MRFFKVLIILVSILTLFIYSLFHFKVIWKLAPYYELASTLDLEVPVMDMTDYEEIWNTHRRPYIYSIKSPKGGGVKILGIEHSRNPKDPQFDSIRYYWKNGRPDVALVEGRVGNLFTWFQDPIEELGEGGLVTQLAHNEEVVHYTWEPIREKQIERLLNNFSPEEIAMFYSFRPYFSNMRFGKPENPEATLQEYLESRTDYPYIRNVFSSWEQLDEKWKNDYPSIDWRDYDSGVGYPPGYMHELWNRINLIRDENMLSIIVELVKQEKNVFVTMGSSHAPRIERSLRYEIDKINEP